MHKIVSLYANVFFLVINICILGLFWWQMEAIKNPMINGLIQRNGQLLEANDKLLKENKALRELKQRTNR